MKGVYTLILIVKKPLKIKIGKLGIKFFKKGIYAYIGSGLGKGATSILGRVKRHLKKRKKMFWHIDYLLSHKNVKIIDIFYAKTSIKIECILNNEISKAFNKNFSIKDFGSSDCKCKTHLIWLGNKNELKRIKKLIKKAYKNVGLEMLKLTK